MGPEICGYKCKILSIPTKICIAPLWWHVTCGQSWQFCDSVASVTGHPDVSVITELLRGLISHSHENIQQEVHRCVTRSNNSLFHLSLLLSDIHPPLTNSLNQIVWDWRNGTGLIFHPKFPDIWIGISDKCINFSVWQTLHPPLAWASHDTNWSPVLTPGQGNH